MSLLNVDKVDPSTGTALELGTSGDTITVPTGAGLTVTDEVKTNKISPATGTAFALGDSGDTFTVPSGATIVNSGTATGFGINQTSFLPTAAPLIINGDMQIAQRATSKTGVTNGDFGIWTCDRINFTESGTMSAVIDITQEALTSGNAYTDGFSNAYKIDVTTADASLAADDFYRTNYRIEGQDLQVFKKGTANAEKFTLAFWVKATKTGTNIVELNDNDNGRHCCAAYTIDTTNTWEHKVLNFAADTTGVWGNDNAESLRINFILGAGSNYTSGTLATAWASNTTANIAVGQVNNFDSTSNNVHITAIQLEVGEYTSADLPPFRHESFGDNYRRCQRYFESSFAVGEIPGVSTNSINSRYNTSWGDGNTPFPGGGMFKVEKRATPSVVLYSVGSTTTGQLQSYGTARSAVATGESTGGVQYCTVTSGTANSYTGGAWTASAEL